MDSPQPVRLHGLTCTVANHVGILAQGPFSNFSSHIPTPAMEQQAARKVMKATTKPKKFGQAPALSRPLWDEWIKFIGQEAGARIAVVLGFTGNFGLRCGEALALKINDINDINVNALRVEGGKDKGKGGRKDAAAAMHGHL